MARETTHSQDISIVTSVLTIKLGLPGCHSLKEKRGRLKPVLNQLRHEFNISVAEVAFQDVWQSALLGCAVISNNSAHNNQSLSKVVTYLEQKFPNEQILEYQVESF